MDIRQRLALWAYANANDLHWRDNSFWKIVRMWFYGLLIPQCQHEGCHNKGDECLIPAFGPTEEDSTFWYCSEHAQEEGFCARCGVFCAGIESFDFGPGRGYCDNCASELASEFAEENIVGYDLDYDPV